MRKTRTRKGGRTWDRILDAAIRCLAKYGDRETTFQRIADECGVSQSLVVHYFKSRERIFPAVYGHLLEAARSRTEASINQENSPSEQLRRYFRVSFEIFRDRPEVPRIFMTLHYLSCFQEEHRLVNSAVRKGAVDRIATILMAGVAAGEFQVENPQRTALAIHDSLTGTLVQIASEGSAASDSALLRELETLVFARLRPAPRS